MPQTPLALYLQDHLAGATAGVRLARRCATTGGRSDAGRALTGVAAEIEDDRATLVRLMHGLGVHGSSSKNAAAWIAERLARLKPNGRMRGEPAMQRLHELEALSLGIAGKIALWQALRSRPAVREMAGIDLTASKRGRSTSASESRPSAWPRRAPPSAHPPERRGAQGSRCRPRDGGVPRQVAARISRQRRRSKPSQ